MRHLLHVSILTIGVLACLPAASMAQPALGYGGPPRAYGPPSYHRPYHRHYRPYRRPPPRRWEHGRHPY